MKLIISIFVLFSTLNSSGELMHELELMTKSQKNILYVSYNIGEKFDFGYTMAAIAWVESNAGKWLINIQDPSFGIYHNNLNTVMKRLNIRDTPFNRNMVAQKLIDDIEFSSSQTLIELKYWEKIHGNNEWLKIWGSYNGGWKINTQYAIQIQYKIKILKRFFKKYRKD